MAKKKAKAKKKTDESYYVLTADGVIAGIKVWPKRGKAGENGKCDVEFKYGHIDGGADSAELLGKPMVFGDEETAKCFAGVCSCFVQAYAATETEVREWMEQKEIQRQQRINHDKRMAEKDKENLFDLST